jgi:DNA polymerase-3 subunit delta'
MNKDLLISNATQKRLENYLAKPAHALIISGAAGSGKETLAKYPYFLEINRPKDKQEISIDEVRKVKQAIELKIPGSKPISRLILINEAHHLSTEAQNSLLKVLEEPSANTVFILTAPNARDLLPTIASRAQELGISAVGLKQAQTVYQAKPEAKVTNAWQLSGGLPGLLIALLEDDQAHPLKQAIEQAKKIIRQSKYERLVELEKLSAIKPNLIMTLEALNKILGYLQHDAIAKEDTRKSQKILRARDQITNALNSLNGNTSAKLVALDLTLKLSV